MIFKFSDIKPNKKDIDFIKNKFKSKKNITKIFDSLNDLIINTYNNNQYNYNSIINIKKYIDLVNSSCLFNENDIEIKRSWVKFNYLYSSEIDLNGFSIKIKSKDIRNDCLRNLCSINFKQLKEIHLVENSITDLSYLKSIKTTNLKILNLSHNKISDISTLSKINLTNLNQLHLDENNISDISPLVENSHNFISLKK